MNDATLQRLRRELKKYASPQKARVLRGFFKTGPGQYGEGDRFIGVQVPSARRVAKKFQDANLNDVLRLLRSPIHEERLTALLILVMRFQKGSVEARGRIYKIYLQHTRYINNWDLVDLSAEKIIGPFLAGKDKKVLYQLARSPSLWERRIAILSTFHFIKHKKFDETLKIAKMLLRDREDLIHKAVGWMLREVGKRDQACEKRFLKKHYQDMPRTMLRYAIEKFSKPTRQTYLKGRS